MIPQEIIRKKRDGHALDPAEIDSVIDAALAEMDVIGITGKKATPFLLSRVAEVTQGRSLAANIQLVYNNAKLAAQIASEFSLLADRSRT